MKIAVNAREYALPPRPIVVVCIDGCADEYLSTSIAKRRMPATARMSAEGYRGFVRGALPSFTNVNNSAIVTGVPPSVTGISGNFFLDPETGEEVMTNSSRFLRCETILAAAAKAGRKVAMVTAKEKLRDLLSVGMFSHGGAIAFSSEKANEARLETHGIDNVEAFVGAQMPPIYSGEASLYVLRAGVRLIEEGRADFLYLSLTDYMQHKFAPHERESLDFYEAMDQEFGRLLELGSVVGLTADHGMNAKTLLDGTPNVIYLEDALAAQFGAGHKVICPITDPYVAHHGALGSYVTVHVRDGADAGAIARWLLSQHGVTEVYDREMAALKLELPADRIGDLVVMCGRDFVLGRSAEHHDLSGLDRPLRSHGGRYEEMVPMVLSHPLTPEYLRKAASDPRNFDIFDFVCNGVEH